MIRPSRLPFPYSSWLPMNHRIVEETKLMFKLPFPIRAIGGGIGNRDVKCFQKLLNAHREQFSSVCKNGVRDVSTGPLFRSDRSSISLAKSDFVKRHVF